MWCERCDLEFLLTGVGYGIINIKTTRNFGVSTKKLSTNPQDWNLVWRWFEDIADAPFFTTFMHIVCFDLVQLSLNIPWNCHLTTLTLVVVIVVVDVILLEVVAIVVRTYRQMKISSSGTWRTKIGIKTRYLWLNGHI